MLAACETQRSVSWIQDSRASTNAGGAPSRDKGLDLKSEKKESLTGNSCGNSPVESSDGGHSHLLWSILSGAGMSGSHHVGLQQGALQVNVMVIQGLVDSRQDLRDKTSKS